MPCRPHQLPPPFRPDSHTRDNLPLRKQITLIIHTKPSQTNLTMARRRELERMHDAFRGMRRKGTKSCIRYPSIRKKQATFAPRKLLTSARGDAIAATRSIILCFLLNREACNSSTQFLRWRTVHVIDSTIAKCEILYLSGSPTKQKRSTPQVLPSLVPHPPIPLILVLASLSSSPPPSPIASQKWRGPSPTSPPPATRQNKFNTRPKNGAPLPTQTCARSSP